MKYLYLVYVDWSDKTQKWKTEDYKKWVDEHSTLCKKEGVKLLWDGIPYTTVESSAFFYETDKPLTEFHMFKNKVFALQGGGLIKYGNTHIFMTWPFNF
jgi:hypothetical protein